MPPTITVSSNRAAALTPRRLLLGLVVCVFAALGVFALSDSRPGDPVAQLAGALGAALLLVPAAFSWHKRVGGAARPRAWFVAHVVASLLGSVLIMAHLSGGNLWSPPGVVAMAMGFLVLQGVFARATLGRQYAQLFARSPAAFSAVAKDRQPLAQLIAQKVQLLARLDAQADEGLFSLQWWHWVKAPMFSWRYAALVREERALVGAGCGVSVLLKFWRRLHLWAACVFVMGLLAHVLVVLFFAGYAAGDEAPYWWHVFAWGAGWSAGS